MKGYSMAQEGSTQAGGINGKAAVLHCPMRGWKMDQTKWEMEFQAALKNGCIKEDISLQSVQNNNFQFSISEVLAEVLRVLTLQKRDKGTGEIQRKKKRLTKYLENSKGKTENFSVQPTLYLCVLKRNGFRGRCSRALGFCGAKEERLKS